MQPIMARTTSDTHTALFLNRITNYLAALFVIILAISILSVWAIRYSIQRDCTNVYHQDYKLLGYWLHIDAGSTKQGCPKP